MSTSSATAKKIEIMEEEPIIESKGKKSSQGRVLLTALAVISIVVLVVGIVLIILASEKNDKETTILEALTNRPLLFVNTPKNPNGSA